MDKYLDNLKSYFKNVSLNSPGADGRLYSLLESAEVDRAVSMMQERDDEVDKAIAEYNTQTHMVMRRPDKRRRNQPEYRVEKLPRNRQSYINEVELFFLLGNPVEWVKGEGCDDEAYGLLKAFLKETHFDSRMRKAKRLAGAETESAKLYRVFRQDGQARCEVAVLARSTGYRLRPLFDQYGGMLAFCCGYRLKDGDKGRSTLHYDFYFPQAVFECRKGRGGWEVEPRVNPLGKIPVVYYSQPKAWDGAVARIDREEQLDSRTADTNNYFADPIAKATADVIESLADPSETGKVIQLRGAGSSFDYINPPQSSQTRESEKRDLERSILFDTMTPDLSFENMRGLGSVSGVAIRNAMVLGYMKRDNRKEVYGELLQRELSLMVEILKIRHPGKAAALESLKRGVEPRFAEPFAYDDRETKAMVAQLYGAGLVSQETAVALVGLAPDTAQEAARIREKQELDALARIAEAEAAASAAQGAQGGQGQGQGQEQGQGHGE